MHFDLTHVLVAVIALGVASQWVAWRFRVPAIVLLSVAGLLAGPVFGVINPQELLGRGLQPVISLCVAIILFEGGMALRLHELREAGDVVRRLTSVGVALAWVFGTLAAHLIGGLSWPVSLVLGAICVVTGPTVVIPLLRAASLNKKTASYLKWEGILNDPTGVLLAVLTFQYFVYAGETTAGIALLLSIGKAVIVGAALGLLGGYLLGRIFTLGKVPEYLKVPLLLASVLSIFVMANAVQHEAGLLAVTLMGVVMGNMQLRSIDEMRRFKEALTVLLVSIVFVLLTANLKPEVLQSFEWRHAAFIVVLLVVVRPLAVFLATIGTGIDWRNRVLVGWIAPRGVVAAATSGVFAVPLVAAGYADATLLVPIVFAVIFTTVLLHGFSLGWLARRLELTAEVRKGMMIVGSSPWTAELAKTLKDLKVDVRVTDTSWHRLRTARMAGVTTYFGEILSDRAEESLELHGYALVLAASSNDAYNALVCKSFSPELGSHKVFQLSLGEEETAAKDSVTGKSGSAGKVSKDRAMAHSRRGVMAFADTLTFEELWRRHTLGWRFQKSSISAEFSQDDWIAGLPPGSELLLLVTQEGGVALNSSQSPLKAKGGDTLLAYTPPGKLKEKPAEKDLNRLANANPIAAETGHEDSLPLPG